MRIINRLKRSGMGIIMKLLFELYWTFFKIGGLTFGGGLTMLPMLEYELVEKRSWVTQDEILDYYAIGQCTPGIIAVNTATFVGHKKKGILGGIFATLGMISPSIVIITLVAAFLKQYMDNIWFQHAMMGVRGIVCALMLNTVINLAKKSILNIPSAVIAVIAMLLALFTGFPTIGIVVLAGITGYVLNILIKKGGKANDN